MCLVIKQWLLLFIIDFKCLLLPLNVLIVEMCKSVTFCQLIVIDCQVHAFHVWMKMEAFKVNIHYLRLSVYILPFSFSVFKACWAVLFQCHFISCNYCVYLLCLCCRMWWNDGNIRLHLNKKSMFDSSLNLFVWKVEKIVQISFLRFISLRSKSSSTAYWTLTWGSYKSNKIQKFYHCAYFCNGHFIWKWSVLELKYCIALDQTPQKPVHNLGKRQSLCALWFEWNILTCSLNCIT